MSAISCSCSRLAAPSGVVEATSADTRSTIVTRRILRSPAGSLLAGHYEVRPAVLRPGALVVAGIEGELLAVAHRLDAVGGDAERQQVRACRAGPSLAQRQIVFRRAPLVAVSFDRDLPRHVFLQDVGVCLQRRLA